MEGRQRFGYLVLAVVLGHVIMISAQINAQPGSTVLESVTFGLFAEVQRLLTTTRDGVTGVWRGYVGLRGLREENEVLSREVASLRLELQEQRALAEQARNLERLLGLHETLDVPTRGARVIATDATPYFRTITIDLGSLHGLRPDLAVIVPAGVVGRVVGVPGQRAAQVQLLVDRNAAAGALIERTRATGVVVGTDDESVMRMDYVSNLQDVRVGDRIVTSGTDGIYPKGFIIGDVTAVAEGIGLYRTIDVAPAVDVSQVEEVLVVIDPRSLMTDARLR